MGRLIRKLRRTWWAIFLPGVLDDSELMGLLRITAMDLANLRTEADARHKPGTGAYWLDSQGRRQWILRQTLPIVCRTLRGARH